MATQSSRQKDRVKKTGGGNLPDAAIRALAEAEERRYGKEINGQDKKSNPAREIGGRRGPDPTRYGDWEKKGIAVDF